jgi:hypothetical protein
LDLIDLKSLQAAKADFDLSSKLVLMDVGQNVDRKKHPLVWSPNPIRFHLTNPALIKDRELVQPECLPAFSRKQYFSISTDIQP